MMGRFLLLVWVGCLLGCGSKEAGDPYVGEWRGEWFVEEEGAVVATVELVKDGSYRLEVRDAEGDVVTWLDGEPSEDGLVFTTGEDAPDRYLSKWRAHIPIDGSELVGQSYPAREFGGFEMRKVEVGEE